MFDIQINGPLKLVFQGNDINPSEAHNQSFQLQKGTQPLLKIIPKLKFKAPHIGDSLYDFGKYYSDHKPVFVHP